MIIGSLARQVPPKDFANILRSFQEDLGRLTRQLADSVRDGDAEEARRAAHALAGAAGGIGAVPLERAARLAMNGHGGAPLEQLAATIEAEAEAAVTALGRLVAEPTALP